MRARDVLAESAVDVLAVRRNGSVERECDWRISLRDAKVGRERERRGVRRRALEASRLVGRRRQDLQTVDFTREEGLRRDERRHERQ